MPTVSLTREELYARLWDEPATKVAVELGLSSVALGKIARSLAVPVPPRGYWAKRAVGKHTAKPALPDAGPNTPLSHSFEVREHATVAHELVALHELRTRFESSQPVLVVPDDVGKLHRLLAKRRGVGPNAHVAIHVATHELRPRAVRVMHVMLMELDRLGLPYAAKGPEPHTGRTPDLGGRIEVDVGGVIVGFNVSEWVRDFWADDPERKLSALERIRAGMWGKSRRVRAGDGKLRIQLGLGDPGLRTWRDDRRGRIETKLDAVFRSMLSIALTQRTRERERAAQAHGWAMAERARAQAEAERQHEEALRADITRRAELLGHAERLRAVIDRVRALDRAEDAAWLEWAVKHVGSVERAVVSALPTTLAPALEDGRR
jgi:hypothetical protein